MSLSYKPLTPVCINDPRLLFENYSTFPVLKTGETITYKNYVTTSVNTSSLTFSCPPPSSNIVVDRNVYVRITARLTFTGIPAVGDKLLVGGNDAPRCYPIASSLENINCTLNNQSFQTNIGDYIHALSRYNIDDNMRRLTHSMTPTCPDQSQNYGDLINSNRNPLNTYVDSIEGVGLPRGAFPYTIIANPTQAVVGTILTSIVDVAFTEPLFLSPFCSGSESKAGFFNISTIDMTLNFYSNLANRMWSHNATGAGLVPLLSSGCVFGGMIGGPTSFTNNQCSLLFTYITPQQTMKLPMGIPVTYPYSNTSVYGTDLPNSNNAQSITYNSNSIQLTAIPLKMFVYVRQKNSDLQASASNTDTFFRIDSLTINFLNNSGLFASASYEQLYDLSRKNGCQLSFSQFGSNIQNANLSASIGLVGSVLCIDFGKDIGLPALLAPSLNNQTQIQVTVSATNISGRSINSTLYLVFTNIGTFANLGPGSSTVSTSVLTQNDILACQQNGIQVSANDVMRAAGGDWLETIRDFGAKLLPYLQKAHDFVKDNKIISKAVKYIPLPGANVASDIANTFGYGYEDQEYGGVRASGMRGGAQLNRRDLHKRLAQY